MTLRTILSFKDRECCVNRTLDGVLYEMKHGDNLELENDFYVLEGEAHIVPTAGSTDDEYIRKGIYVVTDVLREYSPVNQGDGYEFLPTSNEDSIFSVTYNLIRTGFRS